MPGYDGRGPRGLGPMSGRCGSYRILETPAGGHQPVKGIAGLSGRPITIPSRASRNNLARLQARTRELEAKLAGLRRRIDGL